MDTTEVATEPVLSHEDAPSPDPVVVTIPTGVTQVPVPPAPRAAAAPEPSAAPAAEAAPTAPPASDAAPSAKIPTGVFTAEQMPVITDLVGKAAGKARQEGRDSAYNYAFRELGVKSLTEAKTWVESGRTAQTTESARIAELQATINDLKQQLTSRVQELEGQVTFTRGDVARYRELSEQSLRAAAIRLEAGGLGFLNPDDAIKFVDLSAFPVDIAAMQVTGVAEALKVLAAERPYLLRATAPVAATTTTTVTTSVAEPEAPAPVASPAAPVVPAALPPLIPPTPPAGDLDPAVTDQSAVIAKVRLAEAAKSWF